MHCAIYRSGKKPDSYLYIEQEDDFSRVPDSLRTLLGTLEWVMTLELDESRTLAQADPEQVRAQLRAQGYYLQMPPRDVRVQGAISP